MSIPNSTKNLESLTKRGYSLPILHYLADNDQTITFGQIMEKLSISKRGLFLTLIDLEKDGLIERKKSGRSTIVSLTLNGLQIATNKIRPNLDIDNMVENAVHETVDQLEKEGVIKSEWSSNQRQIFIKRIQKEIKNQIEKKNNKD